MLKLISWNRVVIGACFVVFCLSQKLFQGGRHVLYLIEITARKWFGMELIIIGIVHDERAKGGKIQYDPLNQSFPRPHQTHVRKRDMVEGRFVFTQEQDHVRYRAADIGYVEGFE